MEQRGEQAELHYWGHNLPRQRGEWNKRIELLNGANWIKLFLFI